MHKSSRRGYLMVNDKALTKEDAFKLLNFKTHDEFSSAWDELVKYGVMRTDSNGVFYSKRLVEESKRMDDKNGSKSTTTKELEEASRVLDGFHKITGNPVQYPDGAVPYVVARLREGFVLQDFLDVVSVMNKQWKGDEKMAPYIPPSTLYKSKEKFLEYKALAMAQLKKNPTTPSKWSDLDYSAF
jgi:uncharacterized phage protein (TIGR02220 family)